MPCVSVDRKKGKKQKKTKIDLYISGAGSTGGTPVIGVHVICSYIHMITEVVIL